MEDSYSHPLVVCSIILLTTANGEFSKKMGILNYFKNIFGSQTNEQTISKASKGIVRNPQISNYPSNGASHPRNLNTLLDLYKKDPEVQTALTTRADAILQSGWTIDGGKQKINLLKKLGFNYNFLYKIIMNLLIYNHVFIEIERKNNGEPEKLHILETPQMNINYTAHGEIEEYVQASEQDENPRFPPEDIIYIKSNDITSAVWGEVDLKTLDTTLSTKIKIEKFIQSLAFSNSWRQIIKFAGSEDDAKDMMQEIAHGSADPSYPVVALINGQNVNANDHMKLEVLRDPEDLEKFLGLLRYLREQVLMLLKVPPIMVGLPDNSNRSNSDSQIKSFANANISIRNKLIPYFEELFDKIGAGDLDFSWNPMDERSEEQDVEIAEKLFKMGAKPEQLEKLLRNMGLELPDGKFFDDKEQKLEGDSGNEDSPSRQGKMTGEANSKIGTGDDATTRDDQLR